MQLLSYAEGGGATKLKQHLAGRGVEVVHCRNVPPDVREFFQRDIERAKKATADRARERLRREKSATDGSGAACHRSIESGSRVPTGGGTERRFI